MKDGHVAVIDIGKTNAKLALVDLRDLSELAVITRPNHVQPGPPWPHFDVDGHWEFILNGLTDFHTSRGVTAISITTHGACAALLSQDGSLAAPILDYEHTGPEETAPEYDTIRPAFEETGSPRLAMGLNLGAQVHWQFQSDPGLKARTHMIVTYPQYWGFRLTGKMASDVTSLGCHTDLWCPSSGRFSSLAKTLGIAEKIAPAMLPQAILGTIRSEISTRTGMAKETPVFCGIHDSNASLLPHVLTQSAPFSVVSTGTWVIAMSVGGRKVALDPDADTLINVNALGDPVPSARFMGGREFDLMIRPSCPEPTDADIRETLAENDMLLPAVVPESGPFRGRQARWQGAEPAPGSPRRLAAVSFYLALVTARCLENIGHEGTIIVEGPFAANRAYLMMLSAASGALVKVSGSATGTSQGAALLADPSSATNLLRTSEPGSLDRFVDEMRSYAERWRALTSS